jgi:biopolymer transport protein ExbD
MLTDEVDVRLRVDRSVKYDEIAKVLASLESCHIVRVGFANYKRGTQQGDRVVLIVY